MKLFHLNFSDVKKTCVVMDFLCEIIQPVSGVCQSEEQEVKEACEFSLQSLTNKILQFLWLS